MEPKPRSRTTSKRIVIGALLLGPLALLLVIASGGADDEPPGPELSAARPAEEAPALERSLERDTARESITDVTPETLGSIEDVTPAPSEYPVSGHFILTDCFGREFTTLYGEFELITRLNGERRVQSVEMKRGEFAFTVPDPSDFFVHELKLANRESNLDLEREVSGPHEDQRLVLTAREQCEVRLEVVDGMTGAHLSDLEVWSDEDLDSSAIAVPVTESCELVERAGSSPVFLPEVDLDWGTIRTYWVRTEGYAWGKVSVDHTRSGDHRLRLHTAGALTVSIEGLDRSRMGGVDTWLHLHRSEDDGLIAYAQLTPSFVHRWDALTPGTYRISADLGFYWDEPLSLGSGEVDVVASAEASLIIEATPPEVPRGPVLVGGVVRAHEHWRDKGFSLGFHGLGETERWEGNDRSLAFSELKPDPSDPDLLRWSKEVPCEGTWQVSVGYIGVHTDFKASLLNTREVEVSIPDPAELSISVRDAATGHTLPSIGVWYEYLGKTPHKEIVWPVLDYRPESGTHHMAMPAGRVNMRVYCQGYADIRGELDLAPGRHEFEYELEPRARVNLDFMEGSTGVPVSLLDVEVEATPEEGAGELSEIWFQSLVFSEPGGYRVKISGMRGYLDAETFMTVPKEGVVSHPIQLVRE